MTRPLKDMPMEEPNPIIVAEGATRVWESSNAGGEQEVAPEYIL